MRKWILLLLLFCVGCSQSDAGLLMTSQTGAAPTACETAGCDGTYKFCWTGDYAADTDKACFTSGTTVKDGTLSGGDVSATGGQVGNGFRKTANNQFLTWAVNGNDGIDENQGTIWFSIRAQNDTDASAYVFESRIDTDNNIAIIMRPATEVLRVHFEPPSGGNENSSTDTITDNTWTRVAYTWQTAADAGGKHSVKVGAGSWHEEVEDLDDGSSPDEITIGENAAGGSDTTTIDVDNFYVTAGYQDADPYVP